MCFLEKQATQKGSLFGLLEPQYDVRSLATPRISKGVRGGELFSVRFPQARAATPFSQYGFPDIFCFCTVLSFERLPKLAPALASSLAWGHLVAPPHATNLEGYLPSGLVFRFRGIANRNQPCDVNVGSVSSDPPAVQVGTAVGRSVGMTMSTETSVAKGGMQEFQLADRVAVVGFPMLALLCCDSREGVPGSQHREAARTCFFEQPIATRWTHDFSSLDLFSKSTCSCYLWCCRSRCPRPKNNTRDSIKNDGPHPATHAATRKSFL